MNYNILSVILIVIVVGLLTKMYQTKETFETVSRLERGKKICHASSFKPWTLTFPDEDEVNRILNTVLQSINKKYNMNYHLGKVDHVTKEISKNGSTRYVIDFFSVHLDPKRWSDITRRFILDITKTGINLKINLLTVGNAKKYKHPNELALPELEENELILKDSNIQDLHHIIGFHQPVLDYGINSSDSEQKHLSSFTNDFEYKFQRWILPKDAEQKINVFPCRKQHKWWDINGVHHTDSKTDACIGLNTATNKRPVVPEDEPSEKVTEMNEYSWLFDKARGRQSSTEPSAGMEPNYF